MRGRARLGLRPAGQPAGVAPDFSDRTATELRAAYGERALYSSDLRVRTTIDLDLQTALNATLAGLPAGSGPVAVAAVDPRDGGVRALGHVGRRLGTTPADGLMEPFLNAAQLGGGDAVSLAELAGLHAAGTDALSAAQAYGTLVASGRRAQLRDVLAVTLPSGPSGRPLPVPKTESSAQVLPGPMTDQVRDRMMSSPLPSGAQAAALQFPLLAGVSPAMFVGCTLSLCLAVQTGSGPTAATAQPGQGAGNLCPALGRVPGTGRRAGGTSHAEPAGTGHCVPVISAAAPGLGRVRGLAVGRAAGPRATGVVDRHSFARLRPARGDPLGAAGDRQEPAARRRAGTAHRPADEPASSGPPALAVFLGSAAHAVCFPARGRVVACWWAGVQCPRVRASVGIPRNRPVDIGDAHVTFGGPTSARQRPGMQHCARGWGPTGRRRATRRVGVTPPG